MIEVELHATPGAKRNVIGGEHDQALRVYVTAPPDKGKANEAIRKLLVKTLGLPKSQIELTSGATSRRKRFAIQCAPNEQSTIEGQLNQLKDATPSS